MFTFKTEKKPNSDDSFKSSRFQFMNEEEGKIPIKNEIIDAISSKLAINFNQIVELFNERKMLLSKRIETMYEEHQYKVDAISRGRLQDIKNQAKALRDQNITSLVDNVEKLNSTKSLFKKIIEQHNFSQFESIEKAKGKKYYDKLKEIENQLNNKTKKFGILLEELERIAEKERSLFFEVEKFEVQLINTLKKKDNDHIRKAEQINDEVQKRKMILKDNKSSKDKKKREIQNNINSILDTLNIHQNYTAERSNDVEQLYGGSDNLADFDKFLKLFENVIENKVEAQRQEGAKEKFIKELVRVANGYDKYIEQFQKDRQAESALLDEIYEGFRNSLKTTLIEKVYFQEIFNEKHKLTEVLKKCKSYRNLLENFEGDRIKLAKELSRIMQMRSYFAPRLKGLTSEQIRKQELKKDLNQMVGLQQQLDKMEKRYKEFELVTNSYLLAKQSIEREIDEYAHKGNLTEYKAKARELEKVDRQLQMHKESLSNSDYGRLEAKINGDAQSLMAKYADLIKDILVQEETMSCSTFISKLNKRLTLV